MQYKGSPLLTPDMVDLMSEDYLPEIMAEGYASQSEVYAMKDLGVDATPIEKIPFKYLPRFREGGHFILEKGYHRDAHNHGRSPL